MKITDDEVRRAHEFYELGWTLNELAPHFGVARTTLSLRMRLLGLSIRPKGSRPGIPWTEARRQAYERRWGTS